MQQPLCFGEPIAGKSYITRYAAYAVCTQPKAKKVWVLEEDAGWFLPGGGMEQGESPKETLVRELREELGVEVHDMRFIRRYDGYFPRMAKNGKYYTNNAFIFTVEWPETFHFTTEEGSTAHLLSKEEAIRRLTMKNQAEAVNALV